MQGLKATTKHGGTRKRRLKRLKANQKSCLESTKRWVSINSRPKAI